MNLPNFLVIGAAKAGTTSLAFYLRQHPEIYLNTGTKELRFFAYDDHPPAYRGPGDVESDEKAIGKVSPVYLYSERAPHA